MTKNEFIETYFREKYNERLKFARKRVDNYNIAMAEDALQEAFCRAIKYFRTYNAADDFENWFGRILINCINDMKRIERDKGVNQRETVRHDYITDVDMTKEVLDLLDRQKPRNKDILHMYFFYDYKSREVSEFLNISHDVVRDVIRTFRQRARNV